MSPSATPSLEAALRTGLQTLAAALEAPSTDATTQQARQLQALAAPLTPDADPALRSLACRALLAACSQFYRAGCTPDLLAALDLAARLSAGLDPALVADVQLRAIETALNRRDIGYALAALKPLLENARRHGLSAHEARGLMCQGLALQAAGLHEQADALLARALALMQEQQTPRQMADLWLIRTQLKIHGSAAALAAARHACDQALQYARHSPPRLSGMQSASALCNRAALELLNGDAALAARCLDQAEAQPNLAAGQHWLIQLVRALHALRVHADEASRAGFLRLLDADGAPSLAHRVEAYPVAAALYTRLGDSERAVALLNRLADERASGFAALVASAQGMDLAAHAADTGSLLERMAVVAELRDDATGRHCFRVGKLASLLAERIGLDADSIRAMNIAARLHDLGKIAIPDSILLKPGRFEPAERALMQRHTLFGHALLSQGDDPLRQTAALIARHHHERWDGRGYPDGLAGEAIPLPARVAALADVFDALTHARPYKQAWSRQQALQFIAEGSGSLFDPRLCASFLGLMAEMQARWDAFYAELEGEALVLLDAEPSA